MGRRGRIALIGLISEKILSVTPSTGKSYTQGEIINRAGVDASKIQGLGGRIGEVISLPITLIISITALYRLIGVSFLVGVGIIMVTGVYGVIMSKKYQEINKA